MSTQTTATQKAPRQLSENTIARYNSEQLLRHLDRFLDRAFSENAPYRICGFGDIYRLEGDAYVFHCPSAFKDEIEEVLRDTYSRATQNNETHNPTDTGATQTHTRDDLRDEIRAKIETHEANLAELDAIFAECLANANTDADREGAEEIVRRCRELILATHAEKIAELEAKIRARDEAPRQSERLTTRTIRGKSDELTALLDNVISTSLSPDMTQEMTKLFRRSRGEWQLTIVETMGDDREIVGVMFARSSVSQGYWAHSMLTYDARITYSLAVGKKWLREQMINA